MKNYIYIIVFIFTGVLFASCDKDDGAYYPIPSSFSVSPTSVQPFSKDGGSIEMLISAGNLGWRIESTQTWCKISQKYGSGDGKVTITIDKNTTGLARQSEITAYPTFGKDPVKIAINQQ